MTQLMSHPRFLLEAMTVVRDNGYAELDAVVARAASDIRDVLRKIEPRRLTGEQAFHLSSRFAELEKTSGAGLSMLTPRVIETGVFAKEGHSSGQEWLGSLTGSSSGAAKSRLAAAERAAEVPELHNALKAGSISVPELNLVSKAAAADPDAVGPLLELVDDRASHQELSAEVEAAKAATRSREQEHLRRARVRAGRHLRWHQCETGGVRGDFFLEEEQWARVAPGLQQASRRMWRAAAPEDRESFEAYQVDALVDQLSHRGQRDVSARPHCLVLVDAKALQRGTTLTGEVCEIDGIGPVPVETAVELLGEGTMQFIIKEGTDIRTVTSQSRDIAQKTAVALKARDRCCVVPGCGKRAGLETDHIVAFRARGRTQLDNLVRLCPEHHAMKTYGNWEISGHPGHWKWLPPPKPPSAGVISRRRKVIAAQANAGLKPARPLRL